ncbi:MAG: hypothetical protein V4635_04015 [Bacteroidota bacterium]
MKPRECSEQKTEDKSAAKTTVSDDIQISGRSMNNPLLEEDESTSLVGSGDDDRDGGDKKKKAK